MVQLTAKNITVLMVALAGLFLDVFVIFKYPHLYYLYVPFALLATLAVFAFAARALAFFFLVPVAFLGIGLVEFAPAGTGWQILLGIPEIAAIVWFLSGYVGRYARQDRRQQAECARLGERIAELNTHHRELAESLTSTDEQSHFQKIVLTMVQRIIEVLDAREVKNRLVALIEQHFPGTRYTIKSAGTRMDIFDHWVYQRRVPLMVSNVNKDDRFPPPPRPLGWGSLLAAPIIIQKEVYEILRLEDERPYAFTRTHLRIIELLSLMTSIAIDNISLLGSFRDRAVHDGFTGLYNHKYILERLEEEILFAGRYRNTLGVIMIDIDHFKLCNDSYGHQAGDEVLRRLVQVIQSRVRDVDIVARYGGEEFAVLLPQISRDELRAVAESIRQSFAEEVYVFKGERLQATVSLGVSLFPDDANTASQLVRWADQRLYDAKRGGRNCVVS